MVKPAYNLSYQQALDIGQDGLLGCIVEQRGWDVGERMGAFPSGRTPQGLVTVLGAVAAAVGHEPLN